MKNVKTFLLTAFLILFAINVTAQKKSNKILFLNFRFVKGMPELFSMTAVNGKLKTRKGKSVSKQGYSFKVLSKQEKVLYKNSFENPAGRSYEYPGENGEIKRAEIKQDTVNLTLRIPYCASIDKVILYKNANEGTLSKSSSNEKFEFQINHGLIKKEN